MEFENTTHGLNEKLVPMITNEGVLYLGSLAKYFAAFFSMSRSSVMRFKSALRRAFSAERSALSAYLGFGSPYSFSQPYKLCVVVPSRLATLLTEYPLPVTCLTASFFYSSVYRLPFINTSHRVTF